MFRSCKNSNFAVCAVRIIVFEPSRSPRMVVLIPIALIIIIALISINNLVRVNEQYFCKYLNFNFITQENKTNQ